MTEVFIVGLYCRRSLLSRRDPTRRCARHPLVAVASRMSSSGTVAYRSGNGDVQTRPVHEVGVDPERGTGRSGDLVDPEALGRGGERLASGIFVRGQRYRFRCTVERC